MNKENLYNEALIVASQKEKEKSYWLSKFTGEIIKSSFPFDNDPSLKDDTEFKNTLAFELSEDTASGLRRISKNSDEALQVILTAAFAMLLAKYNQHEEVILGTTTYKNNTAEKFINTVLPLRCKIKAEATFRDIVLQIRADIIEGIPYQNFPIETLPHFLDLSSRNKDFALFDVVVLLTNIQDKKDISHIQHNLTALFQSNEKGIGATIEYNAHRYDASTILRIVQNFQTLLESILSNTERSYLELNALSTNEQELLLSGFNHTDTEFPKASSFFKLFEQQVEKTPHHIALVDEYMSLTYQELDARANQIANYLVNDKKIKLEQPIGILMSPSSDYLICILGIMKAGGAYLPIESTIPEERIKSIIDNFKIEIVLSEKALIKTLNRLQWECASFRAFLCLDTLNVHAEEEVEKNEKMDKRLWEYIGENAEDEITGGGWYSSYTGQPLSQKEMSEYANNIFAKLKPILHKKMRVLEIGCASGITMFTLAPHVGLYYGTDISGPIIEKNKQRVKEEGHDNILLECLFADEIDQLEEKDFDLIIINSVIQSFHGHNYLRKVLGKARAILNQSGHIFIGDILDQDLKTVLQADMAAFKEANTNPEYKTKTDWDFELFVSRNFFKDYQMEGNHVSKVDFSNKIYTVENELTRYRYDALIEINKINVPETGAEVKAKYQEDLNVLYQQPKTSVAIDVEPNNLAYIINTSGTTGNPSGVLIQHSNLMNYAHFVAAKLTLDESSKSVITSSFAFDLGYTSVYPLLLTGGTVHVVERETYLLPEKLLDFVKERAITYLKVTPTLLNLLVSSPSFTLERLGGLKYILIGGEEINATDVETVYHICPEVKIINHYGPTETTIGTLTHVIEKSELKRYKEVPVIGKPISNNEVFILNDDQQLMPVGAIGELCVSGAGVGRGYFQNEALTQRKFVSHPFKPGEVLYKTGDLARWLPNGTVHFLGRADNQVKIRGYRIELGEIESQLVKHKEIKQAVVLANVKEKTNEKYLCAYIIAAQEIEDNDLRAFLLTRLPEYMVPSFFVFIDKIPTTQNGKLDRKALPKPKGKSLEHVIAPRNEVEKKLVDIWSQVLGIEKEFISIDADFFDLGGHSVKAVALTSRIHKDFNSKISLTQVFKMSCLQDLAEAISLSEKEEFESIKPAPKKEYYLVSSAQKRLFIMEQIASDTPGFCMDTLLTFKEGPDRQRLEKALHQLVERHESLRTSIHIIDGELYQKVNEKVDFPIAYHETDEENAKEIVVSLSQKFDLSAAPLFRIGVIKYQNSALEYKYVLALSIHHIIFDGTSRNVLIKELLDLYEGAVLPKPVLQYKDFSEWQHERKDKPLAKKQEAFWFSQLQPPLPPTVSPWNAQNAETSSVSNHLLFSIGTPEISQLKSIAKMHNASMFMLTVAIYNVMLHKLSDLEDIIIGTPVDGRGHENLEDIVGMFLNTIALRNFPQKEKTFSEFFAELRNRTLAAFDHQDYLFDDLVEKLKVKRTSGQHSLFSSTIIFTNYRNKSERFTSMLDNKLLKERIRPSANDITLFVSETETHLWCNVRFRASLSKPAMESFETNFREIVSAIVQNVNVKIEDIKISKRAPESLPTLELNFD